MKLILYIALQLTIVSFSTTSCNKEQINPAGQGDNTANAGSFQTLTLTAAYWQPEQSGLYVHTFNNILPSASAINVKVYLISYGQEIPINHSIHFMDGELWATFNTKDVKINFRCRGALPFAYLNIKVASE